MKILIDITHPAHVHFYRNPIQVWRDSGFEVVITARKKDIATDLLDSYGWDYKILSESGSGLSGLAKELVVRNYRLWRFALRVKPDVMTGIGGIYVAQVGALLRIPSVVFTDTENARLSNKLTYPFASAVCTPTCFETSGPKKGHVQYKGYHELSYTHPNRFEPDPTVLSRFGVSEHDPFTFVRLVSWGSAHDVSDSGFSDVLRAVSELSQFGKVLISAEGKLPEQLEPMRVQVAPELVHHLLYYARLVIGESATMASEAATLGTPAIFISTSTRGYTNEQERRYGLVFNYSDSERAQEQGLSKAIEILNEAKPKEHWHEKRKQLLDEKIDVAEFVSDIVREFAVKQRRSDSYNYQ